MYVCTYTYFYMCMHASMLVRRYLDARKCVYGWIDGRMGGWKDGGMDGWKDARKDGWMDGCKEGRKDGWMDRDRSMDRQMHRWIDHLLFGWTGRWIDR